MSSPTTGGCASSAASQVCGVSLFPFADGESDGWAFRPGGCLRDDVTDRHGCRLHLCGRSRAAPGLRDRFLCRRQRVAFDVRHFAFTGCLSRGGRPSLEAWSHAGLAAPVLHDRSRVRGSADVREPDVHLYHEQVFARGAAGGGRSRHSAPVRGRDGSGPLGFDNDIQRREVLGVRDRVGIRRGQLERVAVPARRASGLVRDRPCP